MCHDLISIESICVVREQEQEIGITLALDDTVDGGGEASQKRGNGPRRPNVHKVKGLSPLIKFKNTLVTYGNSVQEKLQRRPVRAKQSSPAGNEARTRRRRTGGECLRQRDGAAAGGRVVGVLDIQCGCTSLAVPQRDLGKIFAVCIAHGGREIFAGDCLAIMPLKIQVHAFSETVFAEYCLI